MGEKIEKAKRMDEEMGLELKEVEGESVLFCGVHLRGVGVPSTEVSPITCLVLRESLQFLF